MSLHTTSCHRDDVRRSAPTWRGLPPRAGIGLKPEHFADILAARPAIGFFEIHAENYLVDGGPMHHYLGRIRERYDLSIHGVGLSIGGEDPLDTDHLAALRRLLDRYQPESFSEHLAWSSHGGQFFNDLLPVPYTPATLKRVCEHIDQAQEWLGRRLLLENPATYVEFASSSLSEAEFIAAIAKRTGCGLLLDINNAYVSCTNHGRNPLEYLQQLPLAAVGQYHLAGHNVDQDSLGAPLLIDSHDTPVVDAVWLLYEKILSLTGPLPSLLERDGDIPALPVLLAEAMRAEALLQKAGPATTGKEVA